MKKQPAVPSVEAVLTLLKKLAKLGVKPAQYNIRSPWDRHKP